MESRTSHQSCCIQIHIIGGGIIIGYVIMGYYCCCIIHFGRININIVMVVYLFILSHNNNLVLGFFFFFFCPLSGWHLKYTSQIMLLLWYNPPAASHHSYNKILTFYHGKHYVICDATTSLLLSITLFLYSWLQSHWPSSCSSFLFHCLHTCCSVCLKSSLCM